MREIIEITVNVPSDGRVSVEVATQDGTRPAWLTLLAAAEYLSAVVASESAIGYEKALELIAEGAVTYKHKLRPAKKGKQC